MNKGTAFAILSLFILFTSLLQLSAQSIARKQSLVEQVECIKESKGSGNLQGGDANALIGSEFYAPFVEAGMLPKDFGDISAHLDPYTKSSTGEEALKDLVDIQRRRGGYVDVERVKIEKPFSAGPKDPNEVPLQTQSETNISVSDGADYEGPEGEKRFMEDLKSVCEMMGKSLGIDATDRCANARKEQLEDLKKMLADPQNRNFMKRLAGAQPSEWNAIIKQEWEMIKKAGVPACFMNEEQQKQNLFVVRNSVTNTSFCFGTSPVFPLDDDIFSGISRNSEGRAIGRAVNITTSGKQEVYPAPVIAIVNGQPFGLNPVYFEIFGGSAEEWKRIIGNSPQYGPGPITITYT